MTQKERLVEILSRYFQIGDSYAYNLTRDKTAFSVGTMHLDDFEEFDEVTVEDIAEYLLTNGVIVPPCKVGTTLFFLYNSPYADKPDLTPRIYKTTDWYFEVDKAGIVINTSDIHSFNKVYDYVLGKTVFLTREEAEKALAEREV